MWHKSYSKIYPGISKEKVWRLWEDVNNWDKWDPDIEYAKMSEPFQVGSSFIFKPKGAGEVKLKLVAVEKFRKFTDNFKFFGAELYGIHEMEETPEGLKMTISIQVTGPLRFIWIKLVAQGIVDTIPEQMDALMNLAKSQQ
jgi:hypothetical protein